MKKTAISLFAGAGGFDIGVDRAGIKTICSIEIDPHCVSTLQHNARGKTIWQVDVRALDPGGFGAALNIRPGSLRYCTVGRHVSLSARLGRRQELRTQEGYWRSR